MKALPWILLLISLLVNLVAVPTAVSALDQAHAECLQAARYQARIPGNQNNTFCG